MRIRTWHIVVVLIAIGIGLFWTPRPSILPPISLEPYSQGALANSEDTAVIGRSDQCAGRERCAIVYLAPWCAVCEAAIPFIQALRERLRGDQRIGLTVVIGNDEMEAILRTANRVGGTVFLDANQELSNVAQISSFPTWLVVDKQLRVINRFSVGAPTGKNVNPEKVEDFIHRYLAP